MNRGFGGTIYRQAAFSVRGPLSKAKCVRRLATDSGAAPLKPPQPTSTPGSSPSTSAPKKKPRYIRRALLYSTIFTATFYGGSVAVSVGSERYRDFFVESVPLGEALIDYAEQYGLVDTGSTTHHSPSPATSPTPRPVSASLRDRSKVGDKVKESRDRLKSVGQTLHTKVEKTSKPPTTNTTVISIRPELSAEIADLVREVEDALKGNVPPAPAPEDNQKPPEPPLDEQVKAIESGAKIYTGPPLPLGFEPPPGYVVPRTAPKDVVAPVDESPQPTPPPPPVTETLAVALQKLSTLLEKTPDSTGNTHGVLKSARDELLQLGERLEDIEEEEKRKIQSVLDDQAREYAVKLLEMEMEAQDRIDSQDEDWRKFFDEEKQRVIKTYRDKLETELEAQSEIINQRLKEEVIAQGIEMQRRWIREVKVQVEQERGGRLAKLDELASDLKKLERLALDNSIYLDENLRLHALWSSLRAVISAIDSPTRRPFRDEIRILRHIALARDDPVITSALDSLESTDIPDVGVEPLADLTTWFVTSVAPRVGSVALVPEQNAGLLTHLASSFISLFRFRRRGLADGDDILSVLARTEYHLNEKDLDSAAREINQLKGTAKELVQDWLNAARRRLEVEQAVETVETQAKVASLLVI